AVERLCQAYQNREKICIHGDFDLEGTSGLALLLKGLECLGFTQLSFYQPKRLTEGYGLHAHAMEGFKEKGVTLVLTVDVGITGHEAVDRARELGLDVIVTDHHLPVETLPSALAILNPNKGSCRSGLGHLCGTGVAFFLLLGIRREFRQRNWLEIDFNPKKLLDCFAIGTLTDLVPLVGENRVLVRHGLIELARTERPGLQLLLEELGLAGRSLSSQEVAIRFAPKLNALSRMELGIFPLDLYLVETREEAQSLIKEVLSNNDKRLKLQAAAEEEAFLQAIARQQQGFVWVWSDQFHQGVVGLVATRLAQTLQVPAFVGSKNKETGLITGSARAPNKGYAHVLRALEFSAGCLEKFGGHASAAGFGVNQARADDLNQSLSQFFESQLENKTQVIEQLYDEECRLEEINPLFMSWLAQLEPFGEAWEPIVLRVTNLEVKSIRELRGGHLKIEVKDQVSDHRMDALWFSPSSQNEFVQKFEFNKEKLWGETVEILAEPQWNYFAGRKSTQLLIRDFKLRA
ncbi:MAG: single-stranded-DNA-specific exonuclease RecJ, partial [Bdellovibrionales bacterium]|nr:single-stranded-DNA-specific exonuclease RecJ [Bdellovibrionales bacterium]